ncbi:MAG: hypothetical protein ACI8TQ_000966 [Planctomycetota bacterium]|jgi:hypothetical protein
MRISVLSLACTSVFALLTPSFASAQCFEAVVTGSDTFHGFPGDQFGQAVGLSADYAISGAHFHDGLGTDSGSAYIFERIGGVWQEVIELEASDITTGDRYGWAAGITSEVAAVGARYNDDAGYGSGSIYIYERVGGTWSETAKVVASVETESDFYGNSVATARDIVATGAPSFDGDGVDYGAVYVIEKDVGGWSETAILTASDAEIGDNFGTDVAIDSGALVVGVKGGDDFGDQSGAAYVFEKIDGSWTETAKLLPPDGGAGDGFGNAVAIHKKTIVIGAILDDDQGTDSGSAYVYQKQAGSWNYIAKLEASNADEYDYFGASVTVSDDVILVGAWGAEAGGIELGAAYKFQNLNDQWIETSILTVGGTEISPHFGYTLELSNGTGMIASRGELGGGVARFFTDMDKTPLYGSNCPGTGGIAPTLSMSGCPAPGGAASIDIKSGLGGSMAFLFVGLTPLNTALPSGCNLLVDPFPRYYPLPLAGAGAGTGSVSLGIGVPTNLPSTSIYMQAILLDSGVVDGYTVTNGLELIIP